MSGSASARLDRPHLRLELSQGISVGIATEILPDGSTRGPAEYFASLEAEYARALVAIADDIEAWIAARDRAFGAGTTLRFEGGLVERWSVELELPAPADEDLRAALAAELPQLVERARTSTR